MRHYLQRFGGKALWFLLCWIPSSSLSQAALKWAIEAPPNSVELIEAVQCEMYGRPIMCFTVKNTSQKMIAYLFFVSPNGTESGNDLFPAELGPGSTLPVFFSVNDFFDQDKKLIAHSFRVAAIIYSDGTAMGSQPELGGIEDQMLGVALEFKRDNDLLAARADDSEKSLRDVIGKIGSVQPPPLEGDDPSPLNSSVRAVILPGVRQSFIDAHENRFSGRGIRQARLLVLALLDRKVPLSEKVQRCRNNSETQTHLIRRISELSGSD